MIIIHIIRYIFIQIYGVQPTHVLPNIFGSVAKSIRQSTYSTTLNIVLLIY